MGGIAYAGSRPHHPLAQTYHRPKGHYGVNMPHPIQELRRYCIRRGNNTVANERCPSCGAVLLPGREGYHFQYSYHAILEAHAETCADLAKDCKDEEMYEAMGDDL